MNLLLLVLLGLAQTPADSTKAPLGTLDSLYAARDTAGLVRALRSSKSDSSGRLRFYRGIAAAWTGRATQSIGILRPLVDSTPAGLSRDDRREAIRTLAESYSRTRRYAAAAALYDAELQSLDDQLEAERRRAAAISDSAARSDTATASPALDELTSPEPAAPPSAEQIPSQISLIGLLMALFLVPKMLQRFKIPGAVTSLLMGVAAHALGLFPQEVTLRLFATLGIVSLFLFAGLEIDGAELRRDAKPLMLHAAIWTLLASLVAILAVTVFGMAIRPAALLSLALVTPSTGFILSSLTSFGLMLDEQRTVRTYAISSELIALMVLFFVLQTTSAKQLTLSLVAMAGVVVVIPLAFRAFAALVAPYAPRSEFAFLLMVGVACAYATRLLGVYYLVGAFLVGVAAQRFRATHPAMSSEKMIDALESFGSVFIPFYFFHAGTEIEPENVTWRAAAIGLLLVLVLVPIRVAVISLHRKLALEERFAVSRRVGSAMIPTLVFTLVILGILTARFDLSPALGGALVLYTIVNTTLPPLLLKARPADFEDVAALPLPEAPADG
jgi:Kef-type K+ transport system membrane component KefB